MRRSIVISSMNWDVTPNRHAYCIKVSRTRAGTVPCINLNFRDRSYVCIHVQEPDFRSHPSMGMSKPG